MASEDWKWQIDPDTFDESLRELGERARKLVADGRYTKVRIKYKGKPVLPDIPLAAMVAAEGVSLALAGPLRLVLMNLGVKAFVEIELVHEAGERVREGQELFAAGEVDAAEAKYREALQMKSDDPSALYHLGVLYRVSGRRDEAQKSLQRAAAAGDHPDAERARDALERMNRGGRTL
jgi:tetratricopeptide (TPR) repeat protein